MLAAFKFLNICLQEDLIGNYFWGKKVKVFKPEIIKDYNKTRIDSKTLVVEI